MSNNFLKLPLVIEKLQNEQAINDANKKFTFEETKLKLIEEMSEVTKEFAKGNDNNFLEEFGDVLLVSTRLYSYLSHSDRLTLLNFLNSKIAKLTQINAAKDIS